MTKLKNDTTPTFKGIIHQFLVALEKCFELVSGETVYIETLGDVSLIGSESKQIEVKFYKGYLTDLDPNVWNTINNWMEDEFPSSQFKSLVLLTTQRVKSDSTWYAWNDQPIAQRKLIFEKIHNSFLRKRNKGEEIAKLFNSIFDPSNIERLNSIIPKIVIDHEAKGEQVLYDLIKDRYAKDIPESRKEDYINHLFGFIINPTTINNNWSITYDKFTNESRKIASRLVETTTSFPPKIEIGQINNEDYENSLFIEKIQEIQLYEVIPEAISDYVQSKLMILREFEESPSIKDPFDEYEQSVLKTFNINRRKANRNVSINHIQDSQNFFDDMMTYDHGKFYTYNTVPPYFQGGLLHILADENDEVNWLLTPKINQHE